MKRAFNSFLFAVLLLFAATLAILTSLPHLAYAQEDCLAQVWKGTVGTVPMVMEFQNEGEDAVLVGRYYYRTGFVDLLLMSDDAKPERWKELDPKGKTTGFITLTCAGKELTGTWASPDGAKTLPIAAEAVPSGSYPKIRLANLKPALVKREAIGKRRYELFKAPGVDDVQGIRLMGEGKPVADINDALMSRFTDKLDEHLDCKALGRWRGRDDDTYGVKLEMSVDAWNKGFVVIAEEHSQYCGGLHPVNYSGATVYNLQTGQLEDTSQWLVEQYREKISMESPLGKVIMKAYNREDTCPDSVQFTGEAAWPTAEGITFLPSASYSESACIEPVSVPYKSMAPYLSPLGKTNVHLFQGG
ncbi:MAG: hypothetical protein LLG06_00755 [Desulfobacteraceae bacterium]|nr:hypothetical protein [Desulfobacteraceae bacterium]